MQKHSRLPVGPPPLSRELPSIFSNSKYRLWGIVYIKATYLGPLGTLGLAGPQNLASRSCISARTSRANSQGKAPSKLESMEL